MATPVRAREPSARFLAVGRVLADSGPLLALFNAGDHWHAPRAGVAEGACPGAARHHLAGRHRGVRIAREARRQPSGAGLPALGAARRHPLRPARCRLAGRGAGHQRALPQPALRPGRCFGGRGRGATAHPACADDRRRLRHLPRQGRPGLGERAAAGDLTTGLAAGSTPARTPCGPGRRLRIIHPCPRCPCRARAWRFTST